MSSSPSRTVVVARIPRAGEAMRLVWTEAERAALAERFGIVAVHRLEADVTVAPWRSGGVSLRGTMRATAVQESILTLEPVEQKIAEDVDLTFIPETSELARPKRTEDGEIELDAEGEDPPEPFTGDSVDIGAALEELLALSLDPYPRASSETFASDEPEPIADEKPSPFAVLKALRGASNDG